MTRGFDRIAVITPVAGRVDHLLRQEDGLRRGSRRPDVRVVVSLDGREYPADGLQVTLDEERATGRLSLARARNAGATAALSCGADLLVFLDVDCIPGPRTLDRYEKAARRRSGLLCGPVDYLPPAPPGGYELDSLPRRPRGHPARPVPRKDELRPADHRLFWSLSFAASDRTWAEVGGFCEDYTGYGAEDTDFGQLARSRGVPMTWVGGAWAFHQHHPTSDPPVEHRDDILRNAALFHRRWGWWPMTGWLAEFARRGLARYDADGAGWVATEPAGSASS